MSRWIDADEFGRCLQNYRPYVDSGRFNAIQTEVNQVLDCIEYEIEDTPSIDIVRCSKCKWYGNEQKKIYECCTYWAQDGGVLVPTKVDDFCSYGERREP